jgi:hypothetical protein
MCKIMLKLQEDTFKAKWPFSSYFFCNKFKQILVFITALLETEYAVFLFSQSVSSTLTAQIIF